MMTNQWHDKLNQVEVTSTDQLRQWLEKNHSQHESVWLVKYRVTVPHKYISNDQMLDELLAFCWMDGRKKKISDEKTMQLISPKRTPYWSRSYKDRIERLTLQGKMHPSGIQIIRKAILMGDWSFYDDVDALILPNDLAIVLKSKPQAAKNYQNFSPSAKREILRRIKLAKTGKTRQKRIAETVRLASNNLAASGTK